MPPKKKGKGGKGKGGKKAAAASGCDAAQNGNDEADSLRKVLRIMQADKIGEKSMLNDFEKQQEKLRHYWNVEKKRLDEKKISLRQKSRDRQDLDEKHLFELNIYKTKIRHLLHEQQCAVTDIRTEAEVVFNTVQDEHRESEQDLINSIWDIKRRQREVEVSHMELVRSFKQQQERNIMELRKEYQRKAEEMRLAYEEKMGAVRKDAVETRMSDIKVIEKKKGDHIAHLINLHKDAFQQIKNYYHDITHNNLDLIKSLKEEVLDMKKKESQDEKSMMEIAQINRKLSEPLKKHLKDVDELRMELKNFERDKILLNNTKDRITSLENSIKNLEWEHEVLVQKFERVDEERDLLKRKLEARIYSTQQKLGFKSLLLEQKAEVLEEAIEKKETSLHEVLVSTNLQPEILGDASRRLEDILLNKNENIKELEERLSEIRKMHYNAVHLYNSRLHEYHISPAELGFEPKLI